MKAAFALLLDQEIFNAVSKTAWQIHRQFGIGIGVRRLPPHISLKQPFDIEDLDALEEYMTHLARSIEPFVTTLSGFDLWEVPPEQPESGILSLKVEPSPVLLDLHYRLNEELTERFGECSAAFDGDAYQFHLTIVAGEASVTAYREAFAAMEPYWVSHPFIARDLALFVYDTTAESNEWQYMTYKILPLGTAAI